MERKKSKHSNRGDKLVLPRSYIGQKPVKIKHIRCRSLTEEDMKKNKLDKNIDNIDNTPLRCKTVRNIKKKVSFNNKIQIININNFKDENRFLYFGNDEEDELNNKQKENKCFSCEIF